MAEGKILLLVEGKRIEPKLFQHFYNLYEIRNLKIVSYCANLYALYHRLKSDYADANGNIEYEFIDLPLFINDYLQLEGDDRLDKNNFREILLVFDFDPQDPSYTREKLLELLMNFSNSTENGKLYINYPMVESYKDIDSFVGGSFHNSTVHFKDVQRAGSGKNKYKKLVNSRTCIPEISKINKFVGNEIIKLHNSKLNSLVVGEVSSSDEKYMELCKKQCLKLRDEAAIWIINTSILHFLHEYGELETEGSVNEPT